MIIKGVFRTQSNIYVGKFCENNSGKKSSVVDVRLGSKYDYGHCHIPRA